MSFVKNLVLLGAFLPWYAIAADHGERKLKAYEKQQLAQMQLRVLQHAMQDAILVPQEVGEWYELALELAGNIIFNFAEGETNPAKLQRHEAEVKQALQDLIASPVSDPALDLALKIFFGCQLRMLHVQKTYDMNVTSFRSRTYFGSLLFECAYFLQFLTKYMSWEKIMSYAEDTCGFQYVDTVKPFIKKIKKTASVECQQAEKLISYFYLTDTAQRSKLIAELIASGVSIDGVNRIEDLPVNIAIVLDDKQLVRELLETFGAKLHIPISFCLNWDEAMLHIMVRYGTKLVEKNRVQETSKTTPDAGKKNSGKKPERPMKASRGKPPLLPSESLPAEPTKEQMHQLELERERAQKKEREKKKKMMIKAVFGDAPPSAQLPQIDVSPKTHQEQTTPPIVAETLELPPTPAEPEINVDERDELTPPLHQEQPQPQPIHEPDAGKQKQQEEQKHISDEAQKLDPAKKEPLSALEVARVIGNGKLVANVLKAEQILADATGSLDDFELQELAEKRNREIAYADLTLQQIRDQINKDVVEAVVALWNHQTTHELFSVKKYYSERGPGPEFCWISPERQARMSLKQILFWYQKHVEDMKKLSLGYRGHIFCTACAQNPDFLAELGVQPADA